MMINKPKLLKGLTRSMGRGEMARYLSREKERIVNTEQYEVLKL
jgi:hypothetical protein